MIYRLLLLVGTFRLGQYLWSMRNVETSLEDGELNGWLLIAAIAMAAFAIFAPRRMIDEFHRKVVRPISRPIWRQTGIVVGKVVCGIAGLYSNHYRPLAWIGGTIVASAIIGLPALALAGLPVSISPWMEIGGVAGGALALPAGIIAICRLGEVNEEEEPNLVLRPAVSAEGVQQHCWTPHDAA